MLEILQQCLSFFQSTALKIWAVVSDICLFGYDLLEQLHVNYPRIEGLVVGVALAWLLSRKDKHPLLRAASSPLKLILDILDLAWDQAVEFLRDVWGTLVGWTKGGILWCRGKAVSFWSGGINLLKIARDKLKKKEKE